MKLRQLVKCLLIGITTTLSACTFSKMFALGVQFCQCSCVNSTGIIDARNKNINLSAEALLLHSYTKVLAQ